MKKKLQNLFKRQKELKELTVQANKLNKTTKSLKKLIIAARNRAAGE